MPGALVSGKLLERGASELGEGLRLKILRFGAKAPESELTRCICSVLALPLTAGRAPLPLLPPAHMLARPFTGELFQAG